MTQPASDALFHLSTSGFISTAIQAGTLVAILAVLALVARGSTSAA